MIIKNISKPIQETLKARERALARKEPIQPNTETLEGALTLNDLASRTTFIRMVSNKAGVRKKVIQGGELVGSTGMGFGFSTDESSWQSYHRSDEEGTRPISGIQNISVEYKGGYKAIRQATINWTVNSLFDLDEMTPHFLTVGKTVLLEWGWIMRNDPPSTFFISESPGEILEEAFSNPMPKILENKGNYDVMAGIISNFEYTLNDSGGFDCVTTLTSIGTNLFESQKVEGESDFKTVVQKDGEKVQKNNIDSLINAIINIDQIAYYNYMGAVNARYKNYIVKQHGIPLNHIPMRDVNRNDLYDSPGVIEVSAQKNLHHVHSPRVGNGKGGVGVVDWMISTKKGLYEEGEVEDVYYTYSGVTFHVEKEAQYRFQDDIFVRWGWFEDNILSRYTSYAKEIGGELVNTFRSVELSLDDNGEPEKDKDGNFKYKSVLIKNNADFLLPKNPMKFFLPGQQIKFGSIEAPYGDLELADNNKELGKFLQKLLTLNEKLPFATEKGAKYGSLRNIMVNTKEIKRAFGIDPDKVTGHSNSKLYHPEDGVKPVSTVKRGVERLLSALSQNFFNFWKFEIVVDSATGNMKVIDRDSSANLKKVLYTKFADNSHKVAVDPKTGTGLGIYKFPAFTLGSIVKTQNLSFKIPDSMAVTAMYGSNKNKGTGLVIDTSNEAAQIESVFNADTDDKYKDDRLAGLEKAYHLSDNAHNIGSPLPDGDIDTDNEKIKFDNSFNIDVRDRWWSSWTTSPKEEDSTEIIEAVDEASKGIIRDPQILVRQINLVLQGNQYSAADVEKIKENNKELKKELDAILKDEKNYEKVNQDNLVSIKPSLLRSEAMEKVKSINAQFIDTSLEGTFYTFKQNGTDDTSGYDLSLFTGGESVVKAKLFGYDKESSAYQTHFIIPAELGLTVDGIGGLTPGDIIQTDYIQQKYNKSVKDKDGNFKGPFTFFQIFNVNQKVSADGWETELTTKMRVNNEVLELSAGEIQAILVPEPRPRPQIQQETVPEFKEPMTQIPGATVVGSEDSPTYVETRQMTEGGDFGGVQSMFNNSNQSGLWLHEDKVGNIPGFNNRDVKTTYNYLELRKDFPLEKPNSNTPVPLYHSKAVQEKIQRADQNREIDRQIAEVGQQGLLSQEDLDAMLNDEALSEILDSVQNTDINMNQQVTEEEKKGDDIVSVVAGNVGAAVISDEKTTEGTGADTVTGTDTGTGTGTVTGTDTGTGTDGESGDVIIKTGKNVEVDMVGARMAILNNPSANDGKQQVISTTPPEPKMIEVLPGHVNNITSTSVKQNLMPTVFQGENITFDDVKVGNGITGGYHGKHGWYIATDQRGQRPSQKKITVIIRSSYRPDDGSSGEQKEFTGTSLLGSASPPYSAKNGPRDKAMLRALAAAEKYFDEKYLLLVEEGTI